MNVATRGTNSVLTKGNTDLITVNRIGNGLKFDGVNDYVVLGTPSVLQFSDSSSFSISAYVEGLSSSVFRPISYYFNNDYLGYIVSITNSVIYLTFGGASVLSNLRQINASFTSRTKCFFTIVKNGTDANNWSIYVDGELLTKIVDANFTPPASYFTAVSTIGALSFNGVVGDFVSATLYDLKVFDVALSSGQHIQLYNSFSQDLTGLTANLVLNLDFNQKSGNTLVDKSTNNLNGTLTNFGATSNLGGGAWVNSLGNTITI